VEGEQRPRRTGIPDEGADKVFSPFFKNAGLGLSISRQIVEEHQGAITFKSVPGRSTTFAVRLPVPCERRSPRVRLDRPAAAD
jgi:signal transduction histidine kinase